MLISGIYTNRPESGFPHSPCLQTTMSSSSAKPDNTPALRTATDDPPTPKVQAEEADDDDYDDLDGT